MAERFKSVVLAGLNTISEHPERFAPTREIPEARKLRLRKFPFSIIYIDRPEVVWVVAVAHGSRRAGYWKERLHSS